jgi:hypothetical protein
VAATRVPIEIVTRRFAMSRSQLILLAAVALSLYGVGNVWPVQVSSYRLYTHVGAREFHEYHLAWWHSIWAVILAPAIALFLTAAVMLWWRPPGVPTWSIWVGFALQLALVLGTSAWWGPLMARLEDANGSLDIERYRLLLSTHWLRVALVTAYGALSLWMLSKSWLSASGTAT